MLVISGLFIVVCLKKGSAVMLVEYENGLLLHRKDKLEERSWRSDENYKLLYTPTGNSVYQTKSSEILFGEKEAAVLNPGLEHKQLYHTEEKLLVEIDQRFMRAAVREYLNHNSDIEFALTTVNNSMINQWIHTVFLFLQGKLEKKEQQFFMENSMMQLVMILFRSIPNTQQQWETQALTVPIQQIIEVLKETYQEDWSLDKMAAHTHSSKFQFSRAFKQETGLSPYTWLQVYRLVQTQQKLIQTDDTILSIAYDAGFKQLTIYNALFKRLYGCTPSAFRARHRMEKK